MHSPSSVCDYFPSSNLSKSFSTNASSNLSCSAGSSSVASRLPVSSSSYAGSSSYGKHVSLSTSATSQSSFLSAFSQDTVVTASDINSTAYLQPLLSEEEQMRRSSSSRRDASPSSHQHSALCLKRTATAPALPVLKDVEHFQPLTLPPLPQLTTHAFGEGMFAASHASTPPVQRSQNASRFVEHFDLNLAGSSSDSSTGGNMKIGLLPTMSATFAELGIEISAVPPPVAGSKYKYGSLPLLRTRSKNLLAGKSNRKATVGSVLGSAPRASSESFVRVSSASPTSADYPFFGADGSKFEEGRPFLYRRGMSLPLVINARSKSSTFLPVLAGDDKQDEEICPSLSITEEQRSTTPFVSSLVPRKATI